MNPFPTLTLTFAIPAPLWQAHGSSYKVRAYLIDQGLWPAQTQHATWRFDAATGGVQVELTVAMPLPKEDTT